MFDEILEEHAFTNGLAEMDATLKVVLVLVTLVLVSISTNPVAPLLIAVTMAACIVLVAGIPVRDYLTLMLLPAPFLLFSFLAILLISWDGGGIAASVPGGRSIEIPAEAIDTAVNAAARTIGGMSALIFLALTTPMVEIFSVMRRWRVPQEFIDLAMLVYRCTFILLGEAIALLNAQKQRQGYSGFRNTLNCLGMMCSVLFMRAWEKGEELVLAMEARCYDGKYAMLPGGRRAKPLEVAAVMGYLALMGALVLLPHARGAA